MPQKVPTSFVPKQPVRTVKRPQARGPLSIFAVAALVLIAASAILAGLVFGYEFYLKREKDLKAEELEVFKESVEPQVVEELARLSQRLVIAQELIGAHVAPSAIFSMLERDTVQGVSFSDFESKIGPSGDVELSMSGSAGNFNQLAYQAVVFRDNPYLRNQIFGDIAVGEESGVTFTFTGIVASSLVRATGGNVEVAPNETLQNLFEGSEEGPGDFATTTEEVDGGDEPVTDEEL